LEDFDEIMGAEREQMAQQGIGSAADEIFREAGAVGAGSSAGGGMTTGSGSGSTIAGEGDGQPSGTSGGGNVNSSGGDSTSGSGSVFEQSAPRERTTPQVEGCEDENTVARQLCEAATDEEDPFLRAALWEEYNEYKRILGRQ
jgi:hypothetical protein